MKALKLSAIVVGWMTLAYAGSASASCGTFEVAKGDVKIQSASGAPATASVGGKICSGDTVIAAKDSRAKIKMEDGNELNISPDSKIVIENYQYDVSSNKKKVLLNVLKGKVRATTREENMYTDKAKDGQANTFQVRTKSAVAGVRGTDFLTSFDPKTAKMDVVTFRGKVEVGTPGPGGQILNSVQVNVGQTTQVSVGKTPSAPKVVPASEMTKMNVETKNETPKTVGGPSASTVETKEKSKERAPAASTAPMLTSDDGPPPMPPPSLPTFGPASPPVVFSAPPTPPPQIQNRDANLRVNLIINH